MGFTGKCTKVRDFVRKVRPEYGVQATYRYETKPGVQAQVDWSEFGKVDIDDKTLKLYCFNDTWLLKNEVYRIYAEY